MLVLLMFTLLAEDSAVLSRVCSKYTAALVAIYPAASVRDRRIGEWKTHDHHAVAAFLPRVDGRRHVLYAGIWP